jgi:ABC-2 type transport system ATP-binding protein
MRVREYLAFRAALKQVPAKRRRAASSRAMDLARIADRAESLVGHLSKGYRQRLGLADALLADPGLLILDEPTSGLDPNQIRDVRHVIADLATSHTVLLSTHILAEVEMSCHRALVVHKGQLVAEGSLEAWSTSVATRSSISASR